MRILGRRVAAEAGWAATGLAYWLRPYDGVRDARRWRWQMPARCRVPDLTDDEWRAVLAAVARRREDTT